MRMIHDYEKSVEVPGVAGLGPVAWSRGVSEIRMPVSKRREDSYVVNINHEERKKMVAENSEVDRIPDHREFGVKEDPDSPWMKLSILGPLASFMFLDVFF